MQRVVFSASYEVRRVQCAVCSELSAVCSTPSAVCSTPSAVCSVQCAVCSVQCAGNNQSSPVERAAQRWAELSAGRRPQSLGALCLGVRCWASEVVK